VSSSSTTDRDAAAWGRDPPPLVRWRSWPLGEHLVWATVVLAGLAAVAAVVYLRTERVYLAAMATAAVATCGWRFFLPVTFELNADGVNQWVFGRHRRVRWHQVRRHRIYSAGVLLLAHEKPSPIDVLWGLFLPWGRRRDEVMAQIEYYLDPAEQD